MDGSDVPTFVGSDEYVDCVRRCVQLQVDELGLLLELYGPDMLGGLGVHITNQDAVDELGDAAAAMEGLSKAATRRAAASLLAEAALPLVDLEVPLVLPGSANASGGGGGDQPAEVVASLRVRIPRDYPLISPPAAAFTADIGLYPEAAQGKVRPVIASGALRIWAGAEKGPCMCELVEWATTELPPLLAARLGPVAHPLGSGLE